MYLVGRQCDHPPDHPSAVPLYSKTKYSSSAGPGGSGPRGGTRVGNGKPPNGQRRRRCLGGGAERGDDGRVTGGR
eukprot:1350175-Prymnesium_polylepis.1